MTYIPVDAQHLQVALQNDAQQWRTTISWAKERYQSYAQNLTVDTMNALGISQTDQGFILAFIADLNRFIELASGTVPSSADDMAYNIAGVLGIM